MSKKQLPKISNEILKKYIKIENEASGLNNSALYHRY